MAVGLTRGWLPRVLLAAFLAAGAAWAFAQLAVPPLKTRVTDLTNTLTAEQRATLESTLVAFEARKGSQVAVLIVPATQPEAIEQYSIRVVEQWKLGRKRVDDGVLLIVAKDDRGMRIEVGRGLEGAIPDAVAKRIVAEVIAPRFKEGDFYGGITAGLDRILRTIEGEPLPSPPPRAQQSSGVDWFQLLLFVAISAYIAGTVLNTLFGRFLGSGVVGAAGGVVGYVLSGLAAAVGIGVVAFLISLLTGAVRGGGWPGRGGSSSGGWGSGGGGWSSGGGSWSSGGGGFSGGGGGFSGGGASGSW